MSEIIYNKKTEKGEIICLRDETFYDSFNSLKKHGAEIVSLEDLAELELKKQIENHGELYGLVKEGILFDNHNKQLIFLKENPLFEEKYCKRASDLFEYYREDLSFNEELINFRELLKVEGANSLNKRKLFSIDITDKRFLELKENRKISEFLFGDFAKDYVNQKRDLFLPDSYDLGNEKKSFVLPLIYCGKRLDYAISGSGSLKAPIIGIIKHKSEEIVKEKIPNKDLEDTFDYEFQIKNTGSLK